MSGSASGRARTVEIGSSPVAVAAAMFGVVFALRLVLDDAQADALCLLFVVPIVLITLAHGDVAGVWAATLATVLLVMRGIVQEVDYGAVGLATRTLVFYAIPTAIWLARKQLAAAPADQPEPRSAAAATPKDLTRRELEVLGLLAAGHTNTQIAEKLVLSVRTVESHRASLQRKLGRPSRPDLVRYALGRGLLQGDGSSV